MATTLSACRWNWCTRTFSDYSALKDHVELDHIAIATPVRRSEVAMLRVAENGASLPELYPSNLSVSATESSSQVQSNYIQRGVMTDPTESPLPSIPDESDESGPAPDAGASPAQSSSLSLKDNYLPMKFAEMRGTPSPPPSPVPSSPGTSNIVRDIRRLKMMRNTLFPVSHRARRNPQSTSPKILPSTPNAPDSTLCPTLSILTETDHTDARHTNTAGAEAFPSSQDVVESQLTIVGDADSLRDMDIDSVLLPGLDSQWQPQSQLPLRNSFETSTFPSTVDPSQLHVDTWEEN